MTCGAEGRAATARGRRSSRAPRGSPGGVRSPARDRGRRRAPRKPKHRRDGRRVAVEAIVDPRHIGSVRRCFGQRGPRSTSRRWSPCMKLRPKRTSTRLSESPSALRSCASTFPRYAPVLVELDEIVAETSTATRRGRTAGGSAGDGRSRPRSPLDYLAICATARLSARYRACRDDLRRQAVEIAESNEQVGRSASCVVSNATSGATGSSIFPGSLLVEPDWVQASVHGGSAHAARSCELEGCATAVRCLHTARANHRAPLETATSSGIAAATSACALEVRATDRLDLRGELVRLAVEPCVRIVVSSGITVRGLAEHGARLKRRAAASWRLFAVSELPAVA